MMDYIATILIKKSEAPLPPQNDAYGINEPDTSQQLYPRFHKLITPFILPRLYAACTHYDVIFHPGPVWSLPILWL